MAVRTRTPQRLQICVLSGMQQDATPMNTASACGVGVVNTEKNIHSARRGKHSWRITDLSIQISNRTGHQAKHNGMGPTKQN